MGQLLSGLSVRATFDGATVTLAVRGVNEFVEVSGTARVASRRSIATRFATRRRKSS